jgi:Flp pilus assembly protein TadG
MRTHKKSGVRGQALIMVTLGLIAMCGLMGLAVDLGWSYFVEKQAQAAADLAALAAVQEASTRMPSAVGFVCPVAPSGTQVYCTAGAGIETCTVVGGTTTSNLWNGCLYAQQNGFTDGGLNGAQTVTIQAYDSSSLPATAPGVTGIAYWVTVRTTQTVPQLFSSVLGNTQGLVSARATAALVSSVVPFSFIALNERGDCINDSHSAGFEDRCGVDVNIVGAGGSAGDGKGKGGGGGGGLQPCVPGGPPATLCAANGIWLASNCFGPGDSNPGCTSGAQGNERPTWAGQTQGDASVWARTARVRTGGAVDDPSKWTPVPTPGDGAVQGDPFKGKPQPPLMAPSGGTSMQACAINGSVIDGGNGSPLNLGPYQYYATSDGTTPTGARIVLSGNIAFSAGGTCPGTVISGAVPSGSFMPYLFYGGTQLAGNINFGPGQYVMVGSSSEAGASMLLAGGNQTITGDTGAGTQFIATDLGYPGLSDQFGTIPAALTNGSIPLYQGHFELKAGNSTNVQLRGIDKTSAPSSLGDYNGSLFWQDRRNSTLRLDDLGNLIDRPCENGCATIPAALTAQGVTSTSPGFVYDAAIQMDLEGTLYQPRGGWFSFQGNADIASGLQIITGMVHMTGGGQVSLLPSPVPIVNYSVALIH